MNKELINKLQAPFKEREIEWRVQSQGQNDDGSVWCKVLAYIDARAIQNRLDDVFTPIGWETKYETIDLGENKYTKPKTQYTSEKNITEVKKAFICTLSVYIDGNKISKQDGSEETQVESFKGGISGAFKRVAASGFGIGRYLYDLETKFAKTSLQNVSGWNKASLKDKNNKWVNFWWETPKLDWRFLPQEETITEEQVLELKKLAKEKKQNVANVLQRFKLERFGEMTQDQYDETMKGWELL